MISTEVYIDNLSVAISEVLFLRLIFAFKMDNTKYIEKI